jgi:hypothetical protein
MTSYVPGNTSVSGIAAQTLDVVELRVISNLLQQQAPNGQQDELRVLRNDQAFELGIVPPVIPGN